MRADPLSAEDAKVFFSSELSVDNESEQAVALCAAQSANIKVVSSSSFLFSSLLCPFLTFLPSVSFLCFEKALVVDDSETNRFILSKILVSLNVLVEEAANGQQAIDMIVAHPRDLDIAFMDIELCLLIRMVLFCILSRYLALCFCLILRCQ